MTSIVKVRKRRTPRRRPIEVVHGAPEVSQSAPTENTQLDSPEVSKSRGAGGLSVDGIDRAKALAKYKSQWFKKGKK